MIPRANPPAIENLSRSSANGNMNRSWSGSRPTWAASAAIWDIIEEVDADLVFDLHSSNGIYGEGGLGQCIFPTSNARSDAQAAKRWINNNLVDDVVSEHGMKARWTVGNNQTGRNPLLSHMVGRERPETKGFLLEPWRIPHEMEPRVVLNTRATVWLMERNGMQFD